MYINPIQGTQNETPKEIIFDEDEMSIIRELLSQAACSYERTTFCHDYCDAN